MHPVWRDHLTAASARIDADGIPRFPEPAAGVGGDCRLFELSHLGLVAVHGDDAVGFLQGQLSNDVRELSESHVQWSSHCSQKGRMLANFLVLRVGETLYLQLPAERVADLLKRLRMFVLRSRVSIEDASDDLARIAIAGDCAAAALSARGLPVPASENGLAIADEIAVIRLPGPTPRIEIIGPPGALRAHWDALRARAEPANTDAWTLLDIRAGLPSVYNATADTFVPQMANMQLIDGVSFRKGCYTGQEVVARMQYLGKLKRRMYIGEVRTETRPQPGDALFSPDSTSQQGSGTIVAASPVDEGRYALLAVVEIKAAEAGEVRLSEDGPTVRLEAPPYGFPAAEETPS